MYTVFIQDFDAFNKDALFIQDVHHSDYNHSRYAYIQSLKQEMSFASKLGSWQSNPLDLLLIFVWNYSIKYF